MFALIAMLVVAIAHVGFMVLETFLWTTKSVRRSFGQTAEQAETTKVLAANQGVYNGALGAMLAWAAIAGNTGASIALLLFVIAVGIFGAATAKWTILVIQAVPAGIALVLVLLGL